MDDLEYIVIRVLLIRRGTNRKCITQFPRASFPFWCDFTPPWFPADSSRENIQSSRKTLLHCMERLVCLQMEKCSSELPIFLIYFRNSETIFRLTHLFPELFLDILCTLKIQLFHLFFIINA